MLLEEGLLETTLVKFPGAPSWGRSTSSHRSAFEAISVTTLGKTLLARGSDAAPPQLLLAINVPRGARASCGRGHIPITDRPDHLAQPHGKKSVDALDHSGALAGLSLTAVELKLLNELRLLPLTSASMDSADCNKSSAGGPTSQVECTLKADLGRTDDQPISAGRVHDVLSQRMLFALARSRPSDMENLLAVIGAEGVRCCGSSASLILDFIRRSCQSLGLQADRLNDEQHTVRLVRLLRKARALEAERRDIPSYLIVGDSQLALIAKHKPATLPEVAEIPGIPRNRVEQYGHMFLRVVADYCFRYDVFRGRSGEAELEGAPLPTSNNNLRGIGHQTLSANTQAIQHLSNAQCTPTSMCTAQPARPSSATTLVSNAASIGSDNGWRSKSQPTVPAAVPRRTQLSDGKLPGGTGGKRKLPGSFYSHHKC